MDMVLDMDGMASVKLRLTPNPSISMVDMLDMDMLDMVVMVLDTDGMANVKLKLTPSPSISMVDMVMDMVDLDMDAHIGDKPFRRI